MNFPTLKVKHVYDLYDTLIHFSINCISFFSWMFFANTFLFWGIATKSWCTSSHPSVSLHNSRIVASPSIQWNLKTKTPNIHTFFIQCLGTNPQYPNFEFFHAKTHKVIRVHRIHVAQSSVKRENVTWTWRSQPCVNKIWFKVVVICVFTWKGKEG
jgi:hypothetical protein